MKILICDDKDNNAKKTKDLIDSRGSVETLHSAKLESTLISFLKDVSGILDPKGSAGNGAVSSDFDKFDVLIVDNNLSELLLGGTRLTAEAIIGYLRAFTDTSYIISLNKNPHVDFDLRYLFGDYQSLADLALNTGHLTNSRLWDEKSEGDFAPWYWPRIGDAVAHRRNQITFIANNFESPVLEALGFPPEAKEYLSLRAKSRFPSSGGMWEAPFTVFFDSSRVLPPAEIERLNALAKKGDELARSAVYRISAYEVERWIRRDVLGTQDVLIDLPHLLSQMPFLLGNNADKLDCWNAALANEEPPFGLRQQLYEEHLIAARFGHDMWVPGPCFWWPSLKSNDALSKLFFEAKVDWPDAVFCEDVSRFVSISEEEDSPQEFEAEIEGSWIRRYIAHSRDYSYSPRSRILGSAA